ncbi:MAG: type II toxin-antitoxin system RelE family toxin [Elusimicrobiota bacterium]
MIFERSKHFKKCYQALPDKIKKKVNKALFFMEKNPRHPSLNVEKLEGNENIWSGRIDRDYRFTFQWIPGGVFLRKVGSHENSYRKP